MRTTVHAWRFGDPNTGQLNPSMAALLAAAQCPAAPAIQRPRLCSTAVTASAQQPSAGTCLSHNSLQAAVWVIYNCQQWLMGMSFTCPLFPAPSGHAEQRRAPGCDPPTSAPILITLSNHTLCQLYASPSPWQVLEGRPCTLSMAAMSASSPQYKATRTASHKIRQCPCLRCSAGDMIACRRNLAQCQPPHGARLRSLRDSGAFGGGSAVSYRAPLHTARRYSSRVEG